MQCVTEVCSRVCKREVGEVHAVRNHNRTKSVAFYRKNSAASTTGIIVVFSLLFQTYYIFIFF